MVHSSEPSGPTSNSSSSSHLGTPRSQSRDQEPLQSAGHPHCPSYRLPLPFLNAQSPHPCPSAPCLAVCTVCIALRKEGTAGVRRRGWREGRLSTHPPSAGPTSLSLLPPREAEGWCLHGRCFCPQPDVPGGAGASRRDSL